MTTPVVTQEAPEPTQEVRFKDFSKKRNPVWFRIDADDFEALSVLPVPVMQVLIGQSNALQTKEATPETLNDVLNIFNTILVPESAVRFAERLKSMENPVDLTQVMEIMVWLMELYGRRPTPPPSDSSAGLPSESDGTTSTAGAPLAQ